MIVTFFAVVCLLIVLALLFGDSSDELPPCRGQVWTVGDVSDSDQIDADPPEPSEPMS